MDFEFSDEQREIRDQVRKLLDSECSLRRVRHVLEGEAPYDIALWRRVGELGYLGAAIPEAYGGLGMGAVTQCVIAEELGRALAPLPVSSSIYLAAEAILQSGDQEAKMDYLPGLASGATIGTLAAAEGIAPLAAAHKIQTRYENGAVTGAKMPVADGMVADVAVVSALVDGVPGLFLVDLRGPGVERTALDSLDPTRPQARIRFERAPARPLGGAQEGAAILRRVLDRAAVLVAFEQVGGADAALAMSVDYAKIRHAFGRAIGSFQAIKHKLADMYVRNELARSNCYYAAWALDDDVATGLDELPLAAAAARVAASEAYEFAAKETIQTHGGIGATWEADMHLFYRRSRLLMLMLDSPPGWRNRLVTQLEQNLAGRS